MINYIAKAKNHLWLPYTQMKNPPIQLEVASAKGSKIFLKDGRVLIDAIASWWSMAHGYNHPHIVKEIIKQAKILPHIMIGGFASDQTYKLAYRLAQIAPGNLNKVFFSDSGSTAIEVAMKIAWQFFINKKQNQKIKFISFSNGYHGDTSGCMSLSDLGSGMHQKFSKILLNNFNLSLPKTQNDLNKFESFILQNKKDIAAIFIEPMVQCAGGMKFIDQNILLAIYQITKKHDLLFIADECATGFYRSGKMFACNHVNIVPDIMAVGKALTGGAMGLAATIVTDEVYDAFLSDAFDHALMHGPTFMGNPLAASAANASLDLFAQNDYQEKVAKIAKTLNSELNKCKNLKNVKDVRVIGAIGVIELENISQNEIVNLRTIFPKQGVFLRPFSNVVYTMPSLNITQKDLKTITATIFDVLGSSSKQKPGSSLQHYDC
jgi:adenosylmethionine-8-amino-7-oxononanoate aminotransferase